MDEDEDEDADTDEKDNNVTLHLVYFICTVGRWLKIVDRQLAKFWNSKFYKACTTIDVVICGAHALTWAPPKHMGKMRVVVAQLDASSYERPALAQIVRVSSAYPDGLICYVHTKGVTKVPQYSKSHEIKCVDVWCDYLEYGVVEQYKMCVDALTRGGFDTCGVNFWRCTGWHPDHYSGNMWWATSHYIQRLRKVPIDAAYCGPEFWITSITPRRSHSMHAFEGRDLYMHLITPDAYQHNLSNIISYEEERTTSKGFSAIYGDFPSQRCTDVTDVFTKRFVRNGLIFVPEHINFNAEFYDPCVGVSKTLRLQIGNTILGVLTETSPKEFCSLLPIRP